MRYAPFGVSSIAWPAECLHDALAVVQDAGCSAVEVAPFGVFGRWDGIADAARRLREDLDRRGMVCSALQGILFGADGVALFVSEASRARLQRHLEQVAALAGCLGAKACVFGAPRQRDPGDLPAAAAWDTATAFFRAVAPAFAAQGSALAFEANARHYGCRFVTTTAEAARLVAEIDRPGIGLQIDTGTLLLEGEQPSVLLAAAPLASHVHVSEPDLQAPGDADHAPIAAALRQSGYSGSLSIEMRAVTDWRDRVPQAVRFVQKVYG